MSDSRTKGRRSSSRAFRPALDGQLEDRVLLSTQTLHQYLETNLGLLKHPQAGVAFHVNKPPFVLNAPRFNRHFRVIHAAAVQTIRGGQAANVVAVDGSHFRIQLGYIPNTVQTSAQGGAGGFYTQSTPCSLTHSAAFTSPTGRHRPGLCHAEWRGRDHRGWLDQQYRADDQRAAALRFARGTPIAMRTA